MSVIINNNTKISKFMCWLDGSYSYNTFAVGFSAVAPVSYPIVWRPRGAPVGSRVGSRLHCHNQIMAS